MKLSRIKKICMARRRVVLTNGDGGCDWIGDGAQYYRIVGMDVYRDGLPELMGLSRKQEDHTVLRVERRRDDIFSRDYNVLGEPMDYMGEATWAGYNYWVFRCGAEAVYLLEDHVAATRAQDAAAEFVLVRDDDGAELVAVRIGVFVDALLSPADPTLAEMMRHNLDDIARLPVRGYVDDGRAATDQKAH